MKLTGKGEKKNEEPCTRAYHKDPMLQEHRLPPARAGAAAAPRDPLEAQDVPVRRRHLRVHVSRKLEPIRARAKSFLSFLFFRSCLRMDARIRCTKRIHDRAKVEWKEQIENLVLLAGVAERRHGQRAGAAAAGNVAAAEGRLLAGGDGEVQGRHHHERDGDRR